jgi:hypothetical protein
MFANMYIQCSQVSSLLRVAVEHLTLCAHTPPLTHHTTRLAIGGKYGPFWPQLVGSLLKSLLPFMPNLQVVHAPDWCMPFNALDVGNIHRSLTELTICINISDPQDVLALTALARLDRLRKLVVAIMSFSETPVPDDLLGRCAEPRLEGVDHLRWLIYPVVPPQLLRWLWSWRFPSLRTLRISIPDDDHKTGTASDFEAFLNSHRFIRELSVAASAELMGAIVGMRISATTLQLLGEIPASIAALSPVARTLVLYSHLQGDGPSTWETLLAFLTSVLASETSGSLGALRILRLNVWCKYMTIADTDNDARAHQILWANLAGRNPEDIVDISHLLKVAERFQAHGVRLLDADGFEAPGLSESFCNDLLVAFDSDQHSQRLLMLRMTFD